MFMHKVCTHFWTELWRRVRLEFVVEWPMLIKRWKTLLLCICLQYVHGLFAQLAHRLHKPLPHPLEDLGYQILPDIGEKHNNLSEVVFNVLLFMFVMWSLSPFVLAKKRFYTVVLYTRTLIVLVTCQVLRVMSFSMTRLPGPAHHCRAGQASAMRVMPKHWWGHLIFDFKRGVLFSCGDLIFSSHTTFLLCGTLAYHEYGSFRLVKICIWVTVAVLCVLIIASRKHYSVDVLVAWWTVPLVFYAYHRRWTTVRPVTEEEERYGTAMSLPQYSDFGQQGNSSAASSTMLEMAPLSHGPGSSLPPPHSIGVMAAPTLSTSEENGTVPQRRGSHVNLNTHYPARVLEEEDAQLGSPGHKADDLCIIS